MKNKKESLLKGIIYILFSQIFIKAMGFVYKIYLTNKSGFGDVGIAIYSSGFQIYALLLTFSSTGVPNAISKLISEKIAVNDIKGAERIFKIGLITFGALGIIGSITLFLSAKFIANVLIQIPESEYCLIALSPSIFFVSISAVIRGYFNGVKKFSITAKSQSVEQVFKTIVTIVCVELVIYLGKKDPKIMAAAANFATSVATLMSLIYIGIYYRKKDEIYNISNNTLNKKETIRIRKTIKQIIKVAFPISISSLISAFNKNIDSMTVVRLLKDKMDINIAKAQYGIISRKSRYNM